MSPAVACLATVSQAAEDKFREQFSPNNEVDCSPRGPVSAKALEIPVSCSYDGRDYGYIVHKDASCKVTSVTAASAPPSALESAEPTIPSEPAALAYKLVCNADGFENPMAIAVRTNDTATVVASWDVGPDIASASYKKAHASDADGQITITAPSPKDPDTNDLTITLRIANGGKYDGTFYMVSTDGDGLSNMGKLECSKK